MTSKILGKTPEEIVIDICQAYNSGKGIFNEKTNAEDLVPAASHEVQVQFLFWVIQMDYATKSSMLYQRANALFMQQHTWLEPTYFLNMPEDKLLDFVKTNFRPRYANEIQKRFKINATKLISEYDGKAINIVNHSTSAVELLKRVKEFRGFGDKLANFLVRTYIDLLKLDYQDITEILPPVDIHDVRLTYEWGFIENKDMTTANINNVKKIWSDACKNANLSWITFDKALWLIGSKGRRTEDIGTDYLNNLGLLQNATR